MDSYKIWNGTSHFMQQASCKVLWPLLHSFMLKLCYQKTKFDQKKTNFWVFLHENTISRSLNPIFFFEKWLVMHLERSQKKFQQIFPKNGQVITVQNDLVNGKKTQFCNFKAVELKNYTKNTWKIDKLKRKCMGNPLLVV